MFLHFLFYSNHFVFLNIPEHVMCVVRSHQNMYICVKSDPYFAHISLTYCLYSAHIPPYHHSHTAYILLLLPTKSPLALFSYAAHTPLTIRSFATHHLPIHHSHPAHSLLIAMSAHLHPMPNLNISAYSLYIASIYIFSVLKFRLFIDWRRFSGSQYLLKVC